MTTFIALPDLHDHAESLKTIARQLVDVDAVLLVGDMTNGSSNHLWRLFSILDELNEHVYAVPGNLDTVRMLAHLAREGVSLHRRHVLLDGLALLGVGGALPFAGKFVFDEGQFATMLADTLVDLAPDTPKVLVCHQPPHNTRVDRLPNGMAVGSLAVREFIERVQPLVCLSGHIHEAIGTDYIGNTLLMNPGPLWASQQYAYLEIIDGTLITAEIRRVVAEPNITYHKGVAWQTSSSSQA